MFSHRVPSGPYFLLPPFCYLLFKGLFIFTYTVYVSVYMYIHICPHIHIHVMYVHTNIHMYIPWGMYYYGLFIHYLSRQKAQFIHLLTDIRVESHFALS